MQLARQPVLAHRDGRHQVEPQEREVGQVVPRERFAVQVRVHQAQAAQPDLAGARAPDVGQREARGVADDDLRDVPLAVEEDADLPVRFSGELGEVPGELGAHDLGAAGAPAVGVAKLLELALLEAEGVAE